VGVQLKLFCSRPAILIYRQLLYCSMPCAHWEFRLHYTPTGRKNIFGIWCNCRLDSHDYTGSHS